MVVTCLYGYIDKQTDGIDRHGDKHKDMENGDKREAIHPDAYCLEFVACRFTLVRFTLVRFTLVRFRFFASIKKFFNFPNFFSNYLIFNAFQI